VPLGRHNLLCANKAVCNLLGFFFGEEQTRDAACLLGIRARYVRRGHTSVVRGGGNFGIGWRDGLERVEIGFYLGVINNLFMGRRKGKEELRLDAGRSL
jgi:hypothetical protein